jgi:ABC-type polar amino acid transport system ATPase subunit
MLPADRWARDRASWKARRSRRRAPARSAARSTARIAGAARDLALRVLARVGLAKKIYVYPDQLSGSQLQRVAIARSLAMQPQLMLFNEITSALGSELTGEVL